MGLQARLLSLVVDEQHRGRGVGKALVEAGEAWARDRGAQKIMVNTSHRRAATHAFYRACGFDATGLRFTKQPT